METKIFYFTGTGNSLMVARDLADEMGGASLVAIPQAVNDGELHLKDACVGIIFPVFYWGIPLIVRKFIEKLKLDGVKYIFAVATYGGYAGGALDQISKLLIKKGSKLDAGFFVKLPENYILSYNIPKEAEQDRQLKIGKQKVKKIAEAVEKQDKQGIEKRVTGIFKFLTPIFYKRVYRFHEDGKKFWTQDSCNGCGTCKKVCPVKNIEMDNRKPRWGDCCEQCLACIHWCPKKAIELSNKTLKRGRYQNPEVNLKDMFLQASNGSDL
ncbi:MAG: EFR1 family ferrodoxin [Clostridia bacterium]|nr:EFR1 family ferrodoxin [Clostridia bacterium]